MNAHPVSHPTDQTLCSYGLGKLDDGAANAVNRHLEQCPECRKRVAELSADTFLGRIRDAQQSTTSPLLSQSQPDGTPHDKGTKALAPPPPETLPPGLADHPDYEIKRELGRGAMGVVYLAHNTLLGRDEVLKVMGRQIMESPGVLDRFLREIRAIARLRHPNIVTAFHATRLGESIVFAMEYVEGRDLYRIVKAKGPFPVDYACNFVYQAALGLQHAHEEGLVHRDIKPGNLMFSRKGGKATVKVLDFGLTKATREETVDTSLTSHGQALGTPDYIAPEQILDSSRADIRSDIYSLGGTLYFLLSGRPPFVANSLYDLYQAHISQDANPLNFLRPEVPAELAALVAKMMAKDPARRFQTPGEVAQALVPFFKKGDGGSVGTRLAVSQTGPLEVKRTAADTSSAPTPSAPSLAPAPSPLVKPPNAMARVEPQWESLIEIPETEPLRKLAEPPRRRPPWMWPAIVAASVFGLINLGILIYATMDDQGRVRIVVDDPKAIVQIDGQGILIGTLRESLTLRTGEHVLTVKGHDGRVKTRKFVVRRGENAVLHVEHEPIASDRTRKRGDTQ